MRKGYLFLMGMLLACSSAFAQRNCGTMDHFDHLKSQNPAAERNMNKLNDRVEQYIRNNPDEARAGGIITIPTVVHVVWRTNTQNISAAQIQSQIDVLNEDFRKLNSDANMIPAAWTNTIADSEIEFCLASRDPQGNPTTGINRFQTTTNSFNTNDNIKYASSGGVDAWPRDSYLNIWVGNLGGGLLGYAQFPGQAAATDGVVIGYNFFGDQGAVSSPFNLGRTTTHEVGHWLGLYHIWGDDGNACSGSDQIADTPNQAGGSSGCPSGTRTDNCTSSAPGIMYMNYMDYTNDACMYSFTNDQRTRMRSILNSTRSAILSSDGCVPVNQATNDAAVTQILSPTGTSCTASITPEVTIRNWGSSTLTSVDIKYQVDAGAVNTFPWTGSLASLASTNVTLPAVAVAAGAHTITIYTDQPNGMVDGDPSNDSQTGNFTTTSPSGGQSPPFSYGFEPAAWPPTGWTINNPDVDYTWERSTSAGYNSASSAWVNNYDYQAPGERDDLVLPAVDLTGASTPMLSWDLSYVLYSQADYSDTLLVYASTDCGATWTKIWEKFDQALTTVSPFFLQSAFTPSGDNDWRNESVSLAAYAGAPVTIKFVNGNDYENNLYIDNINITGVVAIDEDVLSRAVLVYPNPSEGAFNLDINLPLNSDIQLSVHSTMGQEVWTRDLEAFTSGKVQVDLGDVAEGIYFLRVSMEGTTIVKKIMQR